MTEKKLPEAIKPQLDALERISLGAAGLILILIWAAIQNTSDLSIFGIPADRESVYIVAGLTLSALNLGACVFYTRLVKLFERIDTDASVETELIATTHAWIFNPFARFSDRRLTVMDGVSRASVPFLWAFGCAALWSIRIPYESLQLTIVMTVYLASGLAMNLLVISSVGALDRVAKLAGADGRGGMKMQAVWISIVGIATGLVATKLVDVLYFYYPR